MDYHFDSKEDIKLIILTVIQDFNMPVTNAMIVDTVLKHSFAEYFDVQQYLFELTDAELVTYYVENSVRYYSLTKKGRDTVSYFAAKIPLTVRERLLSSAKENAKKLRDSMSVKCEYYKENELEYTVSLRITERGYDLINLKLSVGSEKIAKAISSRFEKDPEGFYTRIFSVLIEENGEI